MQYLGDRAIGRDNNFDSIRWLAASLVIVSHESALLPNGGTEPLARVGGGFSTLGTVAVDVFFVTSGFLVTRSLLERRSLRHFVAARLLRVLPGLAVVLVLSAYVLGPIVTTLPLAAYLTDAAVPAYVARNLNLLVMDPQWGLPGVFADNRHPHAVNGSLWSLWPEVRAYGILLGLGIVALVAPRRAAVIVGVGMAITVVAGWVLHEDPAGGGLEPLTLARLAPYFATGSLLYLLRRRIPHAALLVAAVVAWAAVASTRGHPAFVPMFTLALAFAVVWLAHVPLGPLARWGRHGDVSYGLYIYAFPIQQALAARWPEWSLAAHLTASYVLTLACAFASWRLVEEPALRAKNLFAARPLRPGEEPLAVASPAAAAGA